MGGNLFKAGMAEALGTFFLVFVGGGAICMDRHMQNVAKLTGGDPGVVGLFGFGLLGIALAHGLALMCAVYMTAGKSGGHINPAVTLGLLVIGKIKPNQAMVYIGMQLLGAVVGGIAIWMMFAGFRDVSPYLGTPEFQADQDMPFALGPMRAIGIEALLTFLLMSVVLHTAVDAARAARQMFGLCIGMAVTFGILLGGPYTGAAMNPARYFGTAAVSGQMSQLIVYFVGPIVGAVLAALFYKFFTEEKEAAV